MTPLGIQLPWRTNRRVRRCHAENEPQSEILKPPRSPSAPTGYPAAYRIARHAGVFVADKPPDAPHRNMLLAKDPGQQRLAVRFRGCPWRVALADH